MSQVNGMSPFDDPFETLSDLKGAPLSCLVAMQLAAIEVQAGFLAHATGYLPGEVRDALEFLWVFGFVERLPHGAWRLAQPSGSRSCRLSGDRMNSDARASLRR